MSEVLDRRAATGAQATPLVRVRDLHVRFVSRDATMHAVNGVDIDLAAGEVLCILGESGSGKSVTLRALMKLLPRTARVEGAIEVAGRDVQAMDEGQLQDFRGSDVAMIFQEPMTALDPVFTIGRQIAETVQRHEGGLARRRQCARPGIAGTGADPLGQAAARRLSA
ncbi:ATP-binding cassette domain-containing protein [Siccirubricoccus sp. G192]|uniref:ATP-binding cassette domain-containing protein n=1 Tax=Siccirubricoccus sp. G192 TaxID=2849651 RepID=UPI0020C28C7D|nr:ATP-binding cassette domain-containing protein [Siccirubricoccus sp. G192]